MKQKKKEKPNESIIDMLKRKKVLCRTNYEPIKTNLDFKLTSHEIKHLETYFDFPEALLKRVGNNTKIASTLLVLLPKTLKMMRKTRKNIGKPTKEE